MVDADKHPNSDEFRLSRFPVMLDAAEWWIFCRTFLLLEVPIPQTMDAFLGWVTGVISDLLFWVVGVRGADVLEGGGQTLPQVMGFGLVLLRFLMICGGRDMFPHHFNEKYFSSDFYPWSVDSIGGVTLGAGRAERLRRMLSSYMLCARNYLRIMWMGGGWIGASVSVHLGYDESTWPLGVGTFREVWHRVFLPRTPIDFLLHSVLGAGMYSPEDGSEVGVFQFERVRYEDRTSEGCLGSFLSFSGYACD